MGKTPIEAVDTSLILLNQLGEKEYGVSELAQKVDRPKATVYYHLKTLENHGYVVRRDGKYELGMQLLKLGGQVGTRQDIIEPIETNLKQLATEAHETAVFAVLNSNKAVVIDVERPPDLEKLTDFTIGAHLPLYCSATGKAILSVLSKEEFYSYVNRFDFKEYTHKTIVEKSNLSDQVTNVRQEGYAIDQGERNGSVRSVASPVSTNRVIGALGIVGPQERLYGDRFHYELPHLLGHYVERLKYEL